VEAVREECNKNITVMAEEIKALETVSDVVFHHIIAMCVHIYRSVQKRPTHWKKCLERRRPLRKN